MDIEGQTTGNIPIRVVTLVMVVVHMVLFSTITSYGIPEAERLVYKVLYWISAILFTISFVRASIAPLRKIPEVNATSQEEFCQECGSWKPRRARHGDIGESCVLKMDHHCPFLGTGVGYHNLKFFILFGFYGLIVNYIYIDTAIRYSFSDEKKLYFPVRMFYWMFTAMFAISQLNFIAFNFNSILILYNNTTAADTFEEIELNYPGGRRGLEKAQYIEDSRNIYDRLWLNNMCDILGESLWKWPLPIFHEMIGKGIYYPSIPDFDMKDLDLGDQQKPKSDETMEMRDDTMSGNIYAEKLKTKYRGKILEFNGEHFEMPNIGDEGYTENGSSQ